MLELLKKAFDKFDGLIILAAVFLFAHFDYDNLSLLDKIYIASFAFWSVTKLIRLYILYKNEQKWGDWMKKIFLAVFLLTTFILSGCGGQASKDDPKDESQVSVKDEKQDEASPAQNVSGNLKI